MKKIILILICAGLAAVLVTDSAGMRAAVYDSIMLCLNTVVPSLFAFLALSAFIMSSGLVKGEPALFILSVTGGYPVGAKLLFDKVTRDPTYKSRAQIMLMYCFCPSPVFLIALTRFGIYIWLSNVLACFIFAVAANAVNTMVFKSKPAPELKQPDSPQVSVDVRSFVNAVTSAGSALYKICIMVVAFSVITRLLQLSGVTNSIFHSLIEITNVAKVSAAPALIAALTSMGGVCIMFQTAALTAGRLNLRKFILARIPIAALSAGICHLIIGVVGLTDSDSVYISANTVQTLRVQVSSGGSVIASLCLLVMTLLLLHKSPFSYK